MRYKAIPNTFFANNRKQLAAKLEPDSIAIFFGNYQMPRNGDQYFGYRQQSDFFYLTGIEQEKSALILFVRDNPEKAEEILFILRSSKDLEIWEGKKLDFAEASKLSGIKTVKLIDDFETVLHSMIAQAKNICFNIPEFPKFKPEVSSQDRNRAEKIKRDYPLHQYSRLAPIMTELRLSKQKEEIELIKEACAITHSAFKRVLNTVKPGMKEYQVEAEITREFIGKGASGHAYPPIVAGGLNACYLHYIENDQECKDGDLLLMDFGAEYANYAADLSRTIPVNGKFTPRQRELYNSTLKVFRFARSLMKPGTTINKYHKEVCQLWEEEHIKLGLYTKDDVKKHKGENPLWFNFYMHGTSHFLGLDVHDLGDRDIVLEPGMVLTCEPAIYIAEEKTGIRIENDILITETGNIDLMDDIPIEAEDIEQLMLAGR